MKLYIFILKNAIYQTIEEVEVFSNEQEAIAYCSQIVDKYNLEKKTFEYSLITKELNSKVFNIES